MTSIRPLTRRFALAGFGCLAALGPAAAPQAKEFQQLTIGTLAVGSVYYAAAGVLAKELAKRVKLPVNIQPYGGTTTSLALVEQGELPMAVGAAMEIHDAFKGIEPYKKMPKLRMVGILFPLYTSIVVRNESEIKSIKDLKGKRVAGNFPAMLVGRQLTESLLATENLGWKDVTIVPVPNIQAGFPLLIEKRMDATFTSIGTAQMREIDAQIPGGVRYLSISSAADAIERSQKVAPGTYITPMKKGQAVGILDDINVQAFDTQLVASTHVEDDLVHGTVKGLAEIEAEMQAAFPALREYARAKLAKANVLVPYHPGAVKAYKELGLWSAELEALQAKLIAGAN